MKLWRERSALTIADDRVVVTVEAWEKRFAAFDGAKEIRAKFVFHGALQRARVKIGTRRSSPSVFGRGCEEDECREGPVSFSPSAGEPARNQFKPLPFPAARCCWDSTFCRCGAQSRRYARRRSWRSASVRSSRMRCFQSKSMGVWRR